MFESEDLFNLEGGGESPPGYQIIAGVANTYKALRNPFLTVDEAIELLSAVSYDPELVHAWLDRFNELGGELCDNPNIMRIFKHEMYVALNYRINSLDDVSRAACLNYAMQTWMDWSDFNPDVFLKTILVGAGSLVHISGVMGSGKSDLGCTLGELALAKGFTVITNIAFEGDLPTGLIRCLKLSDLILQMIDARKQGRNVVVLFDEVSQFFSRREAGRGENIQIEKLLRLTRKFRTSIIFVEQIKEGLPSVAMELLNARFHKVAKKKVQYSTRNLERNYNLFLVSVPRTNLTFSTMHLGGFRIDIDLGELFREVLIEDSPEDALRDLIIETVNSREAGKKLTNYSKKEGSNNTPLPVAASESKLLVSNLSIAETAREPQIPLEERIKDMHSKGISKRRIARELHIRPETVIALTRGN